MNQREVSFLLGFAVVALLVLPFVFQYECERARRQASAPPPPKVLRVMAASPERVRGSLSPYGPGFEQELLSAFSHGAGYRIEWLPTTSIRKAFEALEQGKADLVIGANVELPAPAAQADATVRPAAAKSAASPAVTPAVTVAGPVAAGPAYAHYKPVLVHSSSRYGLRRAQDMCEAPILLTANPVLEARLASHTSQLPCRPTKRVAATCELTPILNSLDSGEERFALVDDGRFQLLQPFYPGVRPARQVGEAIPYRWYWNNRDEELATAMESFWRYHETETRLARLTEKYFGFLPASTDYFEIRHLVRTVAGALPRFRDVIEREAAKNGLDPLFLIAVIYQESHFDPEAVSETGVRGLMQITEATARTLGVADRTDPVQSIEGGARYLRRLFEEMEAHGVRGWDRWFFALAAYNRGKGHVDDAVMLARDFGGDGDTWGELKAALPLLAHERYYSRCKNGYTRGGQAVAYVDNIRYYYYVLKGLVALARPEAEDLGALSGLVPPAWPRV